MSCEAENIYEVRLKAELMIKEFRTLCPRRKIQISVMD